MNLREDKAPFWRFFVDGDNQDNHRAWINDVSDDFRVVHEFFGRVVEQGLAQLKYAFSLCRAHANQRFLPEVTGKGAAACCDKRFLLGIDDGSSRCVTFGRARGVGIRSLGANGKQICFVAHNDEGDASLGKLGGNFLFVGTPGASLGYDDAHIATVKYLFGALSA